MKKADQLSQFDQLKEKEITNVWCLNGGGDHYCNDCCGEGDDPRGGTGTK